MHGFKSMHVACAFTIFLEMQYALIDKKIGIFACHSIHLLETFS